MPHFADLGRLYRRRTAAKCMRSRAHQTNSDYKLETRSYGVYTKLFSIGISSSLIRRTGLTPKPWARPSIADSRPTIGKA